MLNFYRGSVSEFEREQVDVHELLAEVVRTNEDLLARQRISLVVDSPPRLPLIHGSHDKLKQVLLNLLLNARDAMPEGGRITIKVCSSRTVLRIDVRDTGTGIRPEHMSKLFDAFFTTKNEVSGVGLGLSVSYAIIQQHNGTIDAVSEVGKGSTFTIQLPVPGEDHGHS
jgi:signal transduction histidine kinase